MITEVAVALTAFNNLRQLTTALVSAKSEIDRQEAAISFQNALLDLQGRIFESQTAQATLQERIAALESELARHKNWSKERDRYSLQEVETGAFVYRLKPEAANGEAVHNLCPQCFEDEVKSILQFLGKHGMRNKHGCNRCNTVVMG
ncbi:hypothetical protein [Chitinimonas sp.]|uniref:hypothetical protein n=1 Tax=Chitinimonas sp. TaxID=1934313 RepID=UPI0035AEC3D3